MQGTIKKLTDKGFGFISQEGEDSDVFFHSSELQDVNFNDLREGDVLNFEVFKSDKGLNATNITKA